VIQMFVVDCRWILTAAIAASLARGWRTQRAELTSTFWTTLAGVLVADTWVIRGTREGRNTLWRSGLADASGFKLRAGAAALWGALPGRPTGREAPR